MRGIGRSHQILVVDADFIASPAEVVMEILAQLALTGDVRRHRSDGHIVSVHLDERSVVIGGGGIVEVVMVQIVAPRRLALIIRSSQQRKLPRKAFLIRDAPAGYCAEFTLPDQTVPKVGEEREV